jgi:hypothetical protein
MMTISGTVQLCRIKNSTFTNKLMAHRVQRTEAKVSIARATTHSRFRTMKITVLILGWEILTLIVECSVASRTQITPRLVSRHFSLVMAGRVGFK